MAVPLRKDEPEFENEELTTADIAGQRAGSETAGGPRPVAAEKTMAERATLDRNVGERNVEADPRGDDMAAPLFPSGEIDGLRSRWKEVQVAFVDEPRKAVEQADTLVASAMKRLAEVFSEERAKLEKQWDRGDNVSTEDLRVALQRYRTFFQRLLAV